MTNISNEQNIEKIERKSKKNMLLGTILGYVAIAISVVYGLFLTPELVERIGDRDYGLYGLSVSIANLLLMDFGLTNTINTYLAKLRAANDKAGVETFLSSAFKLFLMIDIIFIVIIGSVIAAAPYIFKAYTPDQISVLQVCLFIIGCLTLISVPCSCFNAVISTYEKFGMIKTIDIIQKVLYLVFSILSVYLGWGVIGIVCVNAATTIFAIVIRFFYMRFYVGIRLNLRLGVPRQEMKSIAKFSSWGLVIGICSRLVITVTPFILGIVATDVSVTIFSLIITIEQYIFMFGDMTSSFFMAKIARNDNYPTEEERKRHLQELSEKIAKLQFLVIALILAGFVCVGQEFITVWMKNNESYNVIYWCIIMICGYEIVHIPQLSLQNAMFVHGHIAPMAFVAIAKAVVNLALSFWLSGMYANMPETGAYGASIAICCANGVELLLSNIMYRKYLGISLTHYFKSVYIRGGLTVAFTMAAGLGVRFGLKFVSNNYYYLPPIAILVVTGVTVVAVYLLCSFFITFTKEDKGYYKATLKRLLTRRKKPKVEGANG